jgi:hypothetical protein
MNSYYEKIKDKSFSIHNNKFSIHGHHRKPNYYSSVNKE